MTPLYGACDYVRSMIRPPHPWEELGTRAMQEFRDGRNYVYFVGGDVGLIKIGQTASPLCRLSTFNLGSPIELRFLLLIDGGRKEEKKYQDRFAHLRVRGEWFERADELLDFIKGTRKRQRAWLSGSQAPPKHFLNGVTK